MKHMVWASQRGKAKGRRREINHGHSVWLPLTESQFLVIHSFTHSLIGPFIHWPSIALTLFLFTSFFFPHLHTHCLSQQWLCECKWGRERVCVLPVTSECVECVLANFNLAKIATHAYRARISPWACAFFNLAKKYTSGSQVNALGMSSERKKRRVFTFIFVRSRRSGVEGGRCLYTRPISFLFFLFLFLFASQKGRNSLPPFVSLSVCVCLCICKRTRICSSKVDDRVDDHNCIVIAVALLLLSDANWQIRQSYHWQSWPHFSFAYTLPSLSLHHLCPPLPRCVCVCVCLVSCNLI